MFALACLVVSSMTLTFCSCSAGAVTRRRYEHDGENTIRQAQSTVTVIDVALRIDHPLLVNCAGSAADSITSWSTSTRRGLNCLPAKRVNSRMAASWERAFL